MSKEEERSFKTAFVVFVMSCLLVPCAKHDYASTVYWNALVDPDEIQNFDWSAYVIQRLMDAVIKLKADMMRKIRVSNLTGCSLFLQVLYLDSMDLGLWNNRPGLLPRVRFFTTDRMRFMIDTDSSTPEDGRIDVDYGVSQLRCPTEVCYSWAKEAQCVQGMAESSSQSDLLDGTVLMTRELKIPTGVAGPLYLAFLDHRRKLMEASDRQWKSFMRAVVSIVNTSMYDSPVSTSYGQGTINQESSSD